MKQYVVRWYNFLCIYFNHFILWLDILNLTFKVLFFWSTGIFKLLNASNGIIVFLGNKDVLIFIINNSILSIYPTRLPKLEHDLFGCWVLDIKYFSCFVYGNTLELSHFNELFARFIIHLCVLSFVLIWLFCKVFHVFIDYLIIIIIDYINFLKPHNDEN